MSDIGAGIKQSDEKREIVGKVQNPDLALLQSFDTVARLKSFTLAADELCLTQSAVSRQVRTLEDQLGVQLFKRLHRAIELTEQGQRLHVVTRRSIDDITACLATLQPTTTKQITVSASVAFAYFWLMPRLERWRSLHPELDLRILAGDRPAPPRQGAIDVAILFGDGKWIDVQSSLLFGERIYPVCSAGYLKARSKLAEPDDLLDCTLIHLDFENAARGSVTWQLWLATQGVSGRQGERGIRLNSYPMVLQAAQAGQGVALGWSYITDSMIADGRLVCPIGRAIETADGYYVCTRHDEPTAPAVAQFVAWIKSEADPFA